MLRFGLSQGILGQGSALAATHIFSSQENVSLPLSLFTDIKFKENENFDDEKKDEIRKKIIIIINLFYFIYGLIFVCKFPFISSTSYSYSYSYSYFIF